MHPYVRAGGLGFVAGLRTMTAPIALSQNRGRLRTVLLVSALGEFIGDKFPRVPARVSPAPLLGRALSGGYVGWRVAGRDASPLVGAAVGAASAIAGANAGYHARRLAAQRFRLPDRAVALVEDGLAIGAALLLRQRR